MISISNIRKTIEVVHDPNYGKTGTISESTKLRIKKYIQDLRTASENNPEIANDIEFKSQIPELIQDVEDFFTAGLQTGLFTEDIIEKRILPTFEKDFRQIVPLPAGSGLYGEGSGDKVQIRRGRIPSAKGLDERQTKKLYMFHEMGHKILNVKFKSKDRQDDELAMDYFITAKEIIKSKGRRYKWSRSK